MKYLLIMQICSVVMQQCAPPLEMGFYNSNYNCATAGFIKGMETLKEFGEEYVNKNHMLVNFSCAKQEIT
jgi:hypothetical protein